MIHRYALVTKTLPEELDNVLKDIIRMVNSVKGSALNSRKFNALCKDLDSDYCTLLFHTEVRWLSKGNMLERAFKLRKELKMFFSELELDQHSQRLEDDQWNLKFAYLTDIFQHLNALNRNMQGENTNIVLYSDKLKAFIDKLNNWERKLILNEFDMFINVEDLIKEDLYTVESIEDFKSIVREHILTLKSELLRYFPDLSADDFNLVRNPFTYPIERISSNLQDELIDLKNDSFAKDVFQSKTFVEFWATIINNYPQLSQLVIRILVPFVSTYLCEKGFSTLLEIKSKKKK